jgi:DNA topoisomerase-1
MRLIIVESPAKCSKIQGFLGPGNKVVASMGHIRALAHDLDAVGINKNFEPTYEFMKEKSKAIANLKDAAKGATSIVLCSDDDREGEAIAYSLALLLKLNPLTNPRAAFREITKNAVLDALQAPRTIDMNKVNSQQARAMLDMMVGFTISPLLWKHIGGMAALSAGRCQTPALRMVCDVEAVIDSFKSESSWALTGIWTSLTSATTAKWPAAMIDSLSDEESALNYLENHHAEPGAIVKSNTVKPWTESPPQPLMTSTLQQQASNLYHCSPKRTMQIAQKLYEAGHITYMRTDQTTMSKEAVEDARKVVESKWGKTYLAPMANGAEGAKGAKAKKAEVQAQEAHEAIRPTHFEHSKLPDGEDWGIQDHKIYRLIWLRAIQSTMAPAKGDACEVVLELDGDEDLPWQAKWRRTTFPGWKAADEKETDTKKAEKGDEEEDGLSSMELSGEAAWKISESLKAGTKVKWTSLTATPKESKPRGRYTEATLVRDLEKKGIGRPSTFASLISTIVEKTYVEVQDIPAQTQKSKTFTLSALSQWPPKEEEFLLKKGGEKARMVPTPLGKTVLEFTLKHFPDLFAYDFTAGMERRLDKVAEGAEQWKTVLQDTWNSYKDRISELKSAGGASGAKGAGGNAKSREFGNSLKAVLTAKGPLLLKEGATKEETVFYGWPSTVPKKGLHEITEEEIKAFIASVTSQKQGDSMGEWNGHPIYKKKGPYGFYAEWNGTKVNLAEADDVDAVIAKIKAKQEGPQPKTLGPFQIRTGPYGPYLMKVGAAANSAAKGASKAKPQYVSIPKETNIEEMTAQQAGEIFEAGLKAKATAAAAGGKKRFYKK